MFNTPTVFVLGAGASWHYGYPTGESLVDLIIKKADELAAFFSFGESRASGNQPDFIRRKLANTEGLTTREWRDASIEARMLAARLKQVNPTLIDYFLAQNDELQDIGRLVIALVIFDCEDEQYRIGGNPNHLHLHRQRVAQALASVNSPLPRHTSFGDDWLRFVLYKLTSGCQKSQDLMRNDVRFVTFNYDTSLERRLFDGLSNISRFEFSDVEKFLSRDRVLHIYGGIREEIEKKFEQINVGLTARVDMSGFIDSVAYLNRAYKASQGIRTIDGDDKVKNTKVIEAAKREIARAETVYILGFGFDEANSQRIGLDMLRPDSNAGRTVFFTNYNGYNRVGSSAGRILLSDWQAFLPPERAVKSSYQVGMSGECFDYRCEMSLKNVYDALAQDFELRDSS
ncbi:MAG: hypothetical protein ABI963_12655 [Rhizomicrobium sp.]